RRDKSRRSTPRSGAWLSPGTDPEHAPALDRDVCARRNDVQRQQAEDGAITGGPLNAKAFERPERTERGEQDADHQLEEAARDPGHDPLQNQTYRANDDHSRDSADDGHTQLVGVGAERDDDERDLEPFEDDRLEGQHERSPVESGAGPLRRLVLGGATDARQAVGRDP